MDMGRLRTSEFRSRYRPGDRVQGKVLNRPEDGLAWIDFQGLPLLARIRTPVHLGQRVSFLVASLYPEIILKHIDQNLPGEETWDIAVLVRNLLGLRSTFEERFMAGLSPEALLAEKDLVMRRHAFRRSVQADAQGSSALVRIRETVHLINACLAKNGRRRYLYLPWLLPIARQPDLALVPASADGPYGAGPGEYVYRARIGDRPLVATLHIRPPHVACRMYHDDRRMARTLARWAQGWSFGALPLELNLLDPLPLSAWSGADPLEMLFGDREARVSLRI
jgi:hypothetical protein